MREFFHGWRRKAGVISLVMACLLMAAWVRSLSIHDHFELPIGTSLHYLLSRPSGLAWGTETAVPAINYDAKFLWIAEPMVSSVNTDPFAGMSKIHWRRDVGGFHFFTQIDEESIIVQWSVVPYWSLTMPMTLLSAYLILWKPRKRVTPNA